MSEYRGLVNEGSTCYLNSLLQTLFMTPQFRQHVYAYNHDEKKIASADSIPYQLQKLFARLQMNEGSVYSKGLLRSFQWNDADAFQQHDVQEFCRVLFEALEKASKGSNWIERLHSGVMESYISCGLHPRANQEIFMDISLPIKNQLTGKCNQSIEECLYEYLRPERLEGVDCEGCGGKVEVQKGLRFVNLPPILTLQVNRFELNYETMQRQKVNSFLYFPQVLELWRYLQPFEHVSLKQIPKEVFERVKYVSKQKSERETDFGFGGANLSVTGKGIARKKSFEVEAEKKQTKFFDEENKDKRQDETKKLTPQQQKQKNIQLLNDLKADKQKFDKKAEKKNTQVPTVPEKIVTAPPSSSIDDDMLFGTFMEGFDRTGNLEFNQFSDISVANETNKGKSGPKFEKTQAIFQHEQQTFNPQKQYPANTYILYSILVHSGGAYGGHYFAYIFDGVQWFCFNDNNVRKATRQQIRKYGHPKQETSYGANAYLLFYREAKHFRDILGKKVEVPAELLEKVRNDTSVDPPKMESKTYENYKNRFTQIENSVIFKVKYQEDIHTIVISNRTQETMQNVRRQVKQICNVSEEEENWRLRRHDKSQGTLHQIYDGEILHLTLEKIGLRETCYMAVETKTAQQVFEDYDPKNIVVKLNLWREGLTLLTESYLKPTKLYIREEKTFAEFYEQVERALGIRSPIIIKRNFSVGNPYLVYQLEENQDKTLISLRFFNGINFYVEEPTTLKLRWQKQFEDEKYKCQIKFNNPHQGTDKNHEIFIDTRKTLGELKQRISEVIGIGIDEFRVKKSQQVVSQMTAYKKRLIDLRFINSEFLFIEQGRSSIGTIIIRKGTAELVQDQIEFNLGEQTQIEIETNLNTVAELKNKLAQKYGLFEGHLRVRQYRAHQFGEIYRDTENLMKIRDKSLVWEQTQIEDPKGIQVYVRVFNVMTMQLGPLVTIFVQYNGNYEELALIVSQQTSIAPDRILAHKALSNFVDRSLLFQCEWIEVRFLNRPIREQPLYLTSDGDILIIKQSQQPYKAKPNQRQIIYSGDHGSTKNQKKEAALKITVVEQKQQVQPVQKTSQQGSSGQESTQAAINS